MYQNWNLQDAKARFSELVNNALAGAPQIVKRRGENVVVVIAYKDYTHLQAGNKSLKDMFDTAPKLDEEELPLDRTNNLVTPTPFD